MPEVVINGESHRLPAGANVTDAVSASGAPADGRGVAVAVDGEVVARAAWSTTQLSPGARVEVLQAVQGG